MKAGTPDVEHNSSQMEPSVKAGVRSKPVKCLPESAAKISPVPPEEVLEAEMPSETPKSEMERLAPAEKTSSTAEIKQSEPVSAATLEEVQRDVLEAEDEVRQAEKQRQEELEQEIDAEVQQILTESEHAKHGEAAIAAAASEEAATITAKKKALSASEAEHEHAETDSDEKEAKSKNARASKIADQKSEEREAAERAIGGSSAEGRKAQRRNKKFYPLYCTQAAKKQLTGGTLPMLTRSGASKNANN
ncbi:proton pump-interactor BIP131-like [Cyclospora cayetanensis]|uniref:Proton pump-interactor BIP131-like n=1 Tax=Cyclospora cayetanensis TaxID=88456 RepID=A0A6P6RV37_9EIME|nr:proton pump-interactor BIP131-like [Cyclospora cayetanensis]